VLSVTSALQAATHALGRQRVPIRFPRALAILSLAWLTVACTEPVARSPLPPVPVPPENPITEPKRILGKILFWDEQLSSDDTVACGTCHRPGRGGADPRKGIHPARDPGSIDDVVGSPGIRRLNADGAPQTDPIFGEDPQVTARASLNFFAGIWSSEAFWDGRAASEFRDPLTGKITIANGGALESQALAALSNDAEMAKHGRRWDELSGKLVHSRPLGLASNLPADVAEAIERSPSYGELFAAAFGDASITPVRIAFAIATYERTLVADQTDWDLFMSGDQDAMTQTERLGWEAFQSFRCVNCHEPPLFTNNDYLNIGLRRVELDRGRELISGDPEDAGDFKVPSLRNAALKPRFMHTGEFPTLAAAVAFYRTSPALPGRDNIPGAGLYAFNMSQLDQADLVEFIRGALVDPRVAAETFPFDRPTLRSESHEPKRPLRE
jgi:cytochrome c peroxidase